MFALLYQRQDGRRNLFGSHSRLWGTQRLPQLIGRGRATELIITGRMMNAEEALQTGLITQVVAQEDLLATAATLAQKK